MHIYNWLITIHFLIRINNIYFSTILSYKRFVIPLTNITIFMFISIFY